LYWIKEKEKMVRLRRRMMRGREGEEEREKNEWVVGERKRDCG
jgi:hypothetical protein